MGRPGRSRRRLSCGRLPSPWSSRSTRRRTTRRISWRRTRGPWWLSRRCTWGLSRSVAPVQQGAYPGAAPTPVDPQVEQWFRAVDQDNSGQIDAKELGQALANGDGSMFSEEACRTMIHMFDTNSTGTIDINEFGRLFAYIQQLKAMFENFDRDRTGTIDQGEFSQALQQMGYRFSPQFTQNVLAKLDPRDRKLTLDNFIVVSVQVKRLTDSFRTRDKEMKGQALLG